MEQSKFNNTQDIETLKRKLVSYKQALEALKGGGVIEDYLLAKKEYEELKNQVFKLKGEIKTMKEKQDLEILEYEKKVEMMTNQVELVNDTIRDLKQDVSLLMSKVSNINFSDILKKIDKMVDIQYASISSIKEGNTELNVLKEEIAQLKQQTGKQDTNTTTINQNKKTQPSSYRQLQNILQSSKNIQPYSSEENNMMSLHQDHIQKLQRQGNPMEGNKVKRGSMNTSASIQPQEFNSKNHFQEKKISKDNNSFYPGQEQQNLISKKIRNQKAQKSTYKVKAPSKQTNNETIKNADNKEDN
jgi:hypothetical protein